MMIPIWAVATFCTLFIVLFVLFVMVCVRFSQTFELLKRSQQYNQGLFTTALETIEQRDIFAEQLTKKKR